jgi:HSP20 family protein
MTTTLGRIWDELRPTGLRFSSVGGHGEFEVRAEIPGVDPARDIRIWQSSGLLRVEVTRAPTRDDLVRSEFHYGRSIGSVDLPHDVDAGWLSARYHRGVLTIARTADGAPGTPVAIGLQAAGLSDRPLGVSGLSSLTGAKSPD